MTTTTAAGSRASPLRLAAVLGAGAALRRYLPVVLSGLGFLLFLGLDWELLRAVTTTAAVEACALAGLPAATEGLAIRLPDRLLLVTPECTYIDWFLMSAPFLVFATRGWVRRLGALGVVLVATILINVARIALAVRLSLAGADWFWAHDVIDTLIWYPAFGAAVLVWLRRTLPATSRGEAAGQGVAD